MRIERDDKTWLYTVEWDDGRRRTCRSATTIIDAAFGTFRGIETEFLETMLENPTEEEAVRAFRNARYIAERVKKAGEFGSHVHELTELDDHGVLDVENLDPNLRGILDAWRKFREEQGIEIVEAETKVASRLGYAGTLDRIATEQATGHEKLVLLEIKSREHNVWRDCLQTAAYKFAYEEMTGRKIAKRIVVSLFQDGTYKSTENKGRRDLDIFRSALAINQWRENHA